MNYAVAALGCLMIIASVICIILYNTDQNFARALLLIVLIGILLIIGASAYRYQSSWRMHAIFLEYSTNCVKNRPTILVYILLFFAILFVFIVMVIFLFTAFWTAGTLTFDG